MKTDFDEIIMMIAVFSIGLMAIIVLLMMMNGDLDRQSMQIEAATAMFSGYSR